MKWPFVSRKKFEDLNAAKDNLLNTVEDLEKQIKAANIDLFEARTAQADAEARDCGWRPAPSFNISPAKMTHENIQRLSVLAGTSDADRLWQTVLSYADESYQNELGAALRPGLEDGERQFSAGRAASALDFAAFLRDAKLEAQKLAKGEKKN